jgi:16S rRNA (uracil1498-N3)-methyltransferase
VSSRFYLSRPPEDDLAFLSEEESHHFIRVMRGRPGDELILFDGTGWEGKGEAVRIRGGRVEVRILERTEVSREAAIALDMAVAIPKGPRMEAMVRSLTEIGVRRLFPVITARGIARPRDRAITRWRRAVVEASKQCGRNLLMEVDHPRSLPESLPSWSGYGARLLPHPDAETSLADHPVAAPIIALVGPEGGFTPAETGAALSAGFVSVRLGPTTLRIETAACAVASSVLIRSPDLPTG